MMVLVIMMVEDSPPPVAPWLMMMMFAFWISELCRFSSGLNIVCRWPTYLLIRGL